MSSDYEEIRISKAVMWVLVLLILGMLATVAFSDDCDAVGRRPHDGRTFDWCSDTMSFHFLIRFQVVPEQAAVLDESWIDFTREHPHERVYLTFVKTAGLIDKEIGLDVGQQTIWGTWWISGAGMVRPASPPFAFLATDEQSPGKSSRIAFLVFPITLPNGDSWRPRDVTGLAAR